jgi:hypothetical protein
MAAAQVGDAVRKIDGYSMSGVTMDQANTLLKVILPEDAFPSGNGCTPSGIRMYGSHSHSVAFENSAIFSKHSWLLPWTRTHLLSFRDFISELSFFHFFVYFCLKSLFSCVCEACPICPFVLGSNGLVRVCVTKHTLTPHVSFRQPHLCLSHVRCIINTQLNRRSTTGSPRNSGRDQDNMAESACGA